VKVLICSKLLQVMFWHQLLFYTLYIPVAIYRAEAWSYKKSEWMQWFAFEIAGYRRHRVCYKSSEQQRR